MNSPAARLAGFFSVAADYVEDAARELMGNLTAAWEWVDMAPLAQRLFGQASFEAGVCKGLGKYVYQMGAGLVELDKVILLAALYDQVENPTSWRAKLGRSMLGAVSDILLAPVLVWIAGHYKKQLKEAYDEREALLEEITELLRHPLDSIGLMVKSEYEAVKADWESFQQFAKNPSLTSQFEAGVSFGDLLARVLMAILTVAGVAGVARAAVGVAARVAGVSAEAAGAAARAAGAAGESLAARLPEEFPQLTKWARRVRKVEQATAEATETSRVPYQEPVPRSARPTPEERPLTPEKNEPASAASVADKLERYLLNPDHPIGSEKARWFQEALGFTRENAADLAKQLVFNDSRAVQTAVTRYGVKYNQTINITGANGRVIPVTTAWIRGPDGVAKLITAVPGD